MKVPLLAAAALVLAGGTLAASHRAEPRFSHAEHERLFPVCEGCHAGVVSGVAEEVYPAPADCGRCHDGVRVAAVAWEPPEPRGSTLRFYHPEHGQAAAAAGETAGCRACHAAGGAPARMNVGAARPALCLQCHAHEAESHLAGAVDCGRCHVPLARAAGLPPARIAAFPAPPSHLAADFLSGHAPLTRLDRVSCSVCHARESCERCHANADALPAVTALARDARVAALERGREAEYPVPVSHARAEWALTHGPRARAEPLACGNCHTRPTCTGCHVGGIEDAAAAAIRSLPRGSGMARAAASSRDAARLHPVDFATAHGSWAGAGTLECSGCHTQQYCSDCHAGPDPRAFHPRNFAERHAAEAFSGGGDCQSCHSTEAFCRDCHTGAGIASQGRMNAAFHTGQGLWVLSHGQAARTGMESCVSCHRQTDCVQCHSAAGGWGVNPHGPGFDADRIAARNPALCRACHYSDPRGRN
jgi:predicted CXXCH cytochrome family protein